MYFYSNHLVPFDHVTIVQALSQKYKTAKSAIGPVRAAFQDLNGAVGNQSWVKEWEKIEAHASRERGGAMMAYNVSPIQGTQHSFASLSPH